MSESTPTGNVETTQTTLAQTTQGSRAKAGFIVGGTVALFLVGAVAFQFLRPKVGAAQENAAPGEAGRTDARSSASRPALARVNGELIGYDSVADECMQRYGHEVLESFINRTIIDQACRKQGIAITQAEVNEEIVKIVWQLGDENPEVRDNAHRKLLQIGPRTLPQFRFGNRPAVFAVP